MKNTGANIRRVVEATGDTSMAQLLEATGLTRPGVLYHLNRLIDSGEVEYASNQQRGRSVRYRLAYDHRWEFPIADVKTEHSLWERLHPAILDTEMTTSAKDIHTYIFGEIVNNVLEHASSDDIVILHSVRTGETRLSVRDSGVGIFDHIAATAGLPDRLSSVRRLQTGGYTTAPAGHTGQGVFFSSRATDLFSINSGGIVWTTDNLTPDQTLQTIETNAPGTTVSWCLQDKTDRSLLGLFESFSILDDDEIPRFASTAIAVAASAEATQYVTRSAAREILGGKQQFAVIVLDFSGVANIGQGFADEVFRVFPKANPSITMTAINMNEAVAWFVDQAQADLQKESKEGPWAAQARENPYT